MDDKDNDVNDEDYAAFAKNSLCVNIVSSKNLTTEAPPSGRGVSFIQNHLENDRSYKGRAGKKEFKSKRHKKGKKNKGKGKTRLFLDDCGIYV